MKELKIRKSVVMTQEQRKTKLQIFLAKGKKVTATKETAEKAGLKVDIKGKGRMVEKDEGAKIVGIAVKQSEVKVVFHAD